MNEDTRKLLEECTSGCKMALESLRQVEEYAEDDQLIKTIGNYKEKHEGLGKEFKETLEREGKPDKEPGIVASAFSWFTTEIKLMMKGDNHQIAKVMMDGCNMGIQSISEYLNKYKNASKEAVNLAKRLVKTEEDFMQEMKQFL